MKISPAAAPFYGTLKCNVIRLERYPPSQTLAVHVAEHDKPLKMHGKHQGKIFFLFFFFFKEKYTKQS